MSCFGQKISTLRGGAEAPAAKRKLKLFLRSLIGLLLFATAIPVFASVPQVKDGYRIAFQGYTAGLNPLDGATYYNGCRTYTALNTTAAISRCYIPVAGTITVADLYVHVAGTLGSSNAATVSVRLNNTTDTTISAAVTTTAVSQVFSNTGLSIAVAAGDYIELKWVSPTWTTNPTTVNWFGDVFIQTTVSGLPTDANGYLKNDGAGAMTWDSAATVKTNLSLNNVENTALSTWAGTTNLTTLGTITTGTWNGTTLAVNKGGTGQTSYTDGQLLIGNSSGGGLDKTTLTAGTNIDITNGTGSIEIAAPGGAALPPNAEGYLNNDGTGTLSWQDLTGTMTTTCAPSGTGTDWEPCQPFGVLDAVAALGWLLCVVVFLAVGFWPTKKR